MSSLFQLDSSKKDWTESTGYESINSNVQTYNELVIVSILIFIWLNEKQKGLTRKNDSLLKSIWKDWKVVSMKLLTIIVTLLEYHLNG